MCASVIKAPLLNSKCSEQLTDLIGVNALPSVVMADDNPVVRINGNSYLPFTTPEFVEAFSQLETRKDDVFIATWPKSGKCIM